ncbi:hypothetical protein EV182_005214, partial [Spiromyces aspiralis]
RLVSRSIVVVVIVVLEEEVHVVLGRRRGGAPPRPRGRRQERLRGLGGLGRPSGVAGPCRRGGRREGGLAHRGRAGLGDGPLTSTITAAPITAMRRQR